MTYFCDASVIIDRGRLVCEEEPGHEGPHRAIIAGERRAGAEVVSVRVEWSQ